MTEEIINSDGTRNWQANILLDNVKRLEQERDELLEEIKQLHNGRRTEELYTLFGKPIKYWEELEQENERLKELIGKTRYNRLEMYESFETECNKYRSALEEINIIVKQLLQGVSSNCINNTPYLTALSLVEKEINEVLQCE